METVHYLRTITRSWLLILACLIAGGLGGLLVLQTTTPLYRASIQLIVSGAADNAVGDEAARRLLASQRASALAQIAGTPPAIADAATAAGHPGATPAVTSTPGGNGPFLTIDVVDPDPARAQSIATAYPESLPATSVRLEGPTASPVRLVVISPAGLPTQPFRPDPVRDIGLGLAAGLILGLAVAFTRDALNRAVRDSDELQRLTGLTVLGTVPRDSPKVLLPVVTAPRGPRAEAYRQIRTSLVNSSARLPLIIAVTSASPGDGKTSVSTNVAAAFSRAGHRVALVDADLRRPRVSTYFGVESPLGLTEVLSGESALTEALTILDDGRLAILGSGRIPTNPSEALGSSAMADVLRQLADSYEYIFIDTPPVLPVTDALVLAPLVDGVILVVRLGQTTRDRVTHALSALARVNADLLGVVPNQASGGPDDVYSYRYRYGKSAKGGEDSSAPLDVAPNNSVSRDDALRGNSGQSWRRVGESRDRRSGSGTHRRRNEGPPAEATYRPGD